MYGIIIALLLFVVVIVLGWYLIKLKRIIRRQQVYSGNNEGVLTRMGPHTIELMSGLHVYCLPISRLQEFPEIKISILVPFRSRPELLHKSLQSVMKLAVEPESIQIIVRCDLDDKYMTDFQFPDCKNLKILRGDRMKGYASLHFFYTQCAMHASGSLFLLWNDDAQMLTNGWDRNLWNETAISREKHSPGFWALANNHWPYAFPVITRNVTERLGAFARFAYNDAYLYRLAQACGMEQRVLESVRVQHDMPANSGWDEQSFDLYNAGFFNDIINADAKLIKR